jgi:hypothetical protein
MTIEEKDAAMEEYGPVVLKNLLDIFVKANIKKMRNDNFMPGYDKYMLSVITKIPELKSCKMGCSVEFYFEDLV